jgi:DNA adenine methylase
MSDQFSALTPILKADVSKRLVYGAVLIPEQVDLQSEVVSKEEIEQAAHAYLVFHRNSGLQHEEIIEPSENRVLIVESYIIPDGNTITLGGKTYPEGTWMLVVKVLDDEIWADVQSGKLTGFSIGGKAKKIQEP